MQRKKTLTVNLNSIKPHLQFIIFTAVFVVGIVLGCILVGRLESLLNSSSENASSFFELRKTYNILSVLNSALAYSVPYYIIVFLCGTSIIGCVITPIALLLKGFSFGALSGYMYFTFQLEGIMFNALLLIPSTIVCAFGLILLAKESFSFSYLLSGICVKSNKPINIYSNFKAYCLRSLIFSLFALLAVLVDLGMSALFARFFNF